MKPPPAAHLDPSLLVIAAGVAAALHVGKLPPAIGALREALGLTLVEAGFLLSLVQLAGAALGLAFGALADGLGTARERVTRLLKRFEQRGWVLLGRERIELRDPVALWAMASGAGDAV